MAPDETMAMDLFFREFYPHPIEKVWQAISDPAALAVWLMENDFEPRIGRRFKLCTGNPERGWIDCEVLVIEPPTRMVWSWQSNETSDPGRIEINLKSVEGGTELTLAHTGEPDPDRRGRYASGWPGKLADLGKLLSQR